MTFIKTLFLACLLGGLGLARAQTPPDDDPPGRVARLGEITGQVWYYSPDNGDWIAAVQNQPVTNEDRIATDAGAHAELELGSTTLRLDSGTELEVLQLDDTQFVTQLHNGGVAARVRDAAGQFTLNTEEGRFVVGSAGAYRFDRSSDTSAITVLSGQARYEGPNSALPVGAGQRAEFWIDASGVAQYSLGAPVNDAFAAWSAERDRRVLASVTQRYVSPEMTGADDLDRYGRWEQSADYGPLWIPAAVPVGWAPYSNGHWAWVQPWGWTWVDAAPWGFAPFHYGRWVYARNNWCWTPGQRAARPVYAPALVAWVGGPRVEVGVSAGGGKGGHGGPSVGWFPLAPREVYVPSHRVSPRYIREVNITNVTNVTVINNVIAHPQAPRDFGNRRFPHAITVVPSGVMTGREAVGPAAAQTRQTPWVRELATQPGHPTALLAPPVEGPTAGPRRPDPRGVRPPPGAMPEAGGRPAGRPPFQGREREPAREAGRGPLPAQAPPLPRGTDPQNGGRPATAPQFGSPPAAAARPGAAAPIPGEGSRGLQRSDDRRGDRAGERPENGRFSGRPEGVPAPPRAEPGQAPRPAAIAPATAPAPQPGGAPAAAAPLPQPSMHPLPVRGDDRRPLGRGGEPAQPPLGSPPERQPLPQPPQQRGQQPPVTESRPMPPRIERPVAPPAAVEAPQPARPPRLQEAPHAAEPPRPAPMPIEAPRPPRLQEAPRQLEAPRQAPTAAPAPMAAPPAGREARRPEPPERPAPDGRRGDR